MAIKERDIVMCGKEDGDGTLDFPITRLKNITDDAGVKTAIAEGDYIPLMDGADDGQMKKAPVSAIRTMIAEAVGEAVSGAIEEAY